MTGLTNEMDESEIDTSNISNGPQTLLVHRIPDSCNEETIHQLFTSQTYIVPLKVQLITGVSILTIYFISSNIQCYILLFL